MGRRRVLSASLRPVAGRPRELLDLLRPWVDTGGEPVVVRTSGSTGRPKDVVLSRSALLASARATERRLGGPGQWLLALPTSGVAGLQVLVRSAVAGTDPVVLDEHPDLGAALRALTGARRYASLVPTQLFRLDAEDRLGELAILDALLVGGAALDPGLLGRARDAGVTVVRTYGMSETAGGCVYDGRPLDGVELRVVDGDGRPVAAGGLGAVEVRGATMFDGYAHDPAPRDPTAWFATADLGRLDADGVLSVVGRADDVVVSGGVNVPLPAVERALRVLPEVHDVAVVGVPDEEWGTRVVAAVVPADATCLDGVRAERLRDALEDAGLARTWGPRDVALVDAVPLLPGGKVDRLAVRALFGAQDGGPTDPGLRSR